ncbi:MAG TPA: NADH-quinone oxidoreductase subunit J [Myxococcota bacterium]|nr:NADH-quinone oxidoreductase subunit J [Myxococcota bacterium]
MDPVFALLAAVSTGSAAMVVTRRNPVYSAVWMLVCFVSMAMLYLSMHAAFLAAIHVIVYTGAILVLFLFVIMLLNLKDNELGEEHPMTVQAGVAVGCAALFGLIARPVLLDEALAAPLPQVGDAWGSVEQIGMLLFTTYGLPFELVSLLIIAAMLGSMLLAKKKLWT